MKWHLDPSSHLATRDMGRKLGAGGAKSPSNIIWPGPRPACMPSFVLIHPTVWPQYTNVTDRQRGQTRQDRQRSDSIGWSVLQTVAQKADFVQIHIIPSCMSCQDSIIGHKKINIYYENCLNDVSSYVAILPRTVSG